MNASFSELPPAHTPETVPPTQAMPPVEASVRLAAVLEDYLAALQAGRAPDREQLLRDHPDLAADLRQCLAGIDFIHRAALPAESAPARLGDFRIVREVGRGGMGVVYEAEQISLKRRVALKVLRYGAAPDAEAMLRFQREAETIAGLHHTNIVPIFAIGSEDGVHYYAMQFIEGQSLAEHLARGRRDCGDVAQWGLQAAEALAHAHQRGVIHRDIKPSNLILDPDGRIWLTDFGLAKRADDVSLSLAGALLGTPRYMSPEQASSLRHPIDHRTDLYSLGATLYELATGRPLFDADSPHAMISQILSTDPPAPRQVCPELPRDFETILLKCLSKEPGRRYATAQALADDLRAFVEGRPIRARRASVVERAGRWLKQQRRSVGVAAATVAATIAVVAVSLVAWQLRAQSQLASLKLDTPRDGAQHAEVAEIFNEREEPVGAPFTLPTKEPLALPAGAYRLRLSTPGRLSQTYLFNLVAGETRAYDVGLANETVGAAVALRSPIGAAVLPGQIATEQRAATEPRLYVGPTDAKQPTLRCYAASAQPGWNPDGARSQVVSPLWEADWGLDSPLVAPLLATEADQVRWRRVLTWFDPWWFRNGAAVEIVEPARDLDGDGILDVIWAAPRSQLAGPPGEAPPVSQPALLVAASGKDGRPLWWFVPQAAQLLTAPVWSGDVLVVGLRAAAGSEEWLEAVAPQTGESRWRLPTGGMGAAWLSAATVDGQAAVVAVVGDRLLALDAATGQGLLGTPARLVWDAAQMSVETLALDAHSATAEPRRPVQVLDVRFADLDGDSAVEALLTVQADSRGQRDVAFSLAKGRTLWEAASSFEIGAFHEREARHSWPLIADLDGDGKPEVVLPGERETGATAADGCRVLDGLTGDVRWSRRFPRATWHPERPPEQLAVGPDVDGDGQREVVLLSVRRESHARGRGFSFEQRSRYVLYVDCFSGRDGRSLWWRSIPLPVTEHSAWMATPETPLWWRPDAHGHPCLVVPVRRHPDQGGDETGQARARLLFVLSPETGRIAHTAEHVAALRLVDWNQDGLEDLAVFVPDDPADFEQNQRWPDRISGQFEVWRGAPPEAFRRLGPWSEEQDFDGDGLAELVERHASRGDYAVHVASGADGRLAARWQVRWPETPRSFTVGEVQTFPAPLGDFDGDGHADALLSRDSHFWDFVPRTLATTGRLPILLQAVSGRTGRRIWASGSLQLPEWMRPTEADDKAGEWNLSRQTHQQRLQPLRTQLVDLDDDQRPEVLQLFGLAGLQAATESPRTPQHLQQLYLALIDGRTGALRWAEPCTELVAGDSWSFSGANAARHEDSADLNGDGVRDVVTLAPRREADGWWSSTVAAHSGRDGKRLWGPVPCEGRFLSESEWPAPQLADLDGDGRFEIVLMESNQPLVRALQGDTGAALWSWRGAAAPGVVRPGLAIVARSQPAAGGSGSATAATNRADVAPKLVVVSFSENGSAWELAVLDARGKLTDRIPAPWSQLWTADLDGDGGAELLRLVENTLRATRGGVRDIVWEWTPPQPYGSITSTAPGPGGRPQIVAVSGDALITLDGPTGKPTGRSWQSARIHLTMNNREVDLNRVETPSAGGQPRVVTRVADREPLLQHVVSRNLLPTDERGRYAPQALAPARPNEGRTTRDHDPRLLRPLPWAPRTEWGLSLGLAFALQAARAAGLTLVLLLMPYWLIRAGVRRRDQGWLCGGCVAAGVGLFTAVLALARWASSGMGGGGAAWVLPLVMAVSVLPMLAWPAAVLRSVVRSEWRRLAWLLGGSALAAVGLGTLLLVSASATMPVEQRYSWSGWWLILPLGAMLVGALLVVIHLCGPVLGWLWRTGRSRMGRHA